MRFRFTGTGTNVCYMEELKNIEKIEQEKGQMEREGEEKVEQVF